MTPGDAFRHLGLTSEVTVRQLKKRYHRMVFEHHPDRNPGNQDSVRQFVRARQAYLIARRHLAGQPSAARCQQCGREGDLLTGLDRRKCCRMCLLRGRGWLSLPAPPTVIVSCAFAIIAMIISASCLTMQIVTGDRAYGWVAIIASTSMLLFLALISVFVGYAEPSASRRRKKARGSHP